MVLLSFVMNVANSDRMLIQATNSNTALIDISGGF